MKPTYCGSVTRIVLDKDGEFVDTPGVNFETSKIQVVGLSDVAIALRIEGHSAWAGNGAPREHVPLEIIVCRITGKKKWRPGQTLYMVEPLVEFSPNKRKLDGA